MEEHWGLHPDEDHPIIHAMNPFDCLQLVQVCTTLTDCFILTKIHLEAP
jgi:hypothetical protein